MANGFLTGPSPSRSTDASYLHSAVHWLPASTPSSFESKSRAPGKKPSTLKSPPGKTDSSPPPVGEIRERFLQYQRASDASCFSKDSLVSCLRGPGNTAADQPIVIRARPTAILCVINAGNLVEILAWNPGAQAYCAYSTKQALRFSEGKGLIRCKRSPSCHKAHERCGFLIAPLRSEFHISYTSVECPGNLCEAE